MIGDAVINGGFDDDIRGHLRVRLSNQRMIGVDVINGGFNDVIRGRFWMTSSDQRQTSDDDVINGAFNDIFSNALRCVTSSEW